ncbi:MAG: hypothetical protein WA771_12305 [Chthoniobacterales bacterium]
MKKITVDRPDWNEICVVCTKSTRSNRGFAELTVDGAQIFVCCPGCMIAYEDARDRYLARRETLNPSDLGGMH